MPAININGQLRNVTWAKIICWADAMGIAASQFAHNYSPPPGANNMYFNAAEPTQVTTNVNPFHTPGTLDIPQAIPTQAFTIDEPMTMTQDELTNHMEEIVSMFTLKKKVAKPSSEGMHTGKLLQEIYKYKQMSLRKTDSVTYEKSASIKGKPFEWVSGMGMVGIEIEVENIRNGISGLQAYWDVKADGSLRNNGVELVSVPLQIKQVQLALEHVYECMYKSNDPDFSNRTSIHIHVNCRDLTQDQIFNFVLLYALFEKHFYQVAGARRMNSIFCVPLFRTNQMSTLNEVIYGISPNWHKYCGINLLPLFQNSVTQGYGTIEFRHLYGTKDQTEILHWINDIMCLRKFACDISKKELLDAIKTMNTTSSYMSMYSQVFAKGRRLLSNKKDFEECVSNIKRELFGNEYSETLRKTDQSAYWLVSRDIGARG